VPGFRSGSERTTLFYASDVHGSEKCFLKFVNAAKFYKADAIILGGDLTGKVVVPLVAESASRWTASFQGQQHALETDEERLAFEKTVRFNGFYPVVLSRDEYDSYSRDKPAQERLFAAMMLESLRRWVDIADSRLADTGVRCIVYPGNDDELYIDDVIAHSEVMENPDGRVIQIGAHELIGMGHVNVTPFDSPRELTEEALLARIETVAASLHFPERAIFSLHCPPLASGLDMAPRLRRDESGELRVVTSAGHTVMDPVGSSAVRQAIERYQPLLGAHGHIHESRGTARLGRTLCFNPGSEYSEGILRGALVVLDRDKVRGCQLVAA